MTAIGTLVSFTAGNKIASTDVNANFLAIRTAFNTSAVLTDTSTTITVSHSFTVNQQFAGGITVVSGQAIIANGVSITGAPSFAGTPLFTHGFTISAGVGYFASNVTCAAALSVASTLQVSGVATLGANVTCGAALNVVGALVVAGTASFAANVTCAAALNVAGALTVTGAAILGNGTTTNSVTAATGQALLLASDSNRGWLIAAATGKVNHNGVAGVVCANATLATSATVGYVYIPTFPSTGTGVPATEIGTVALAYDTGSNRLMAYNGAWRTVLFA